MKVLVSGASGLIGSALLPSLRGAGHETVSLVRTRGNPGIYWDPLTETIDNSALEGCDAIVHLAGESIASRRWTTAQKTKILDSRVKGTRLLATALSKNKKLPQVMVSASAIGFYGDRGDEVLRETSSPGTDFLAGVCRQWEAAAEPLAKVGVRVVHPRFGIVLSKDGGALPKIALPFRLGIGGKVGSGKQYMSWVALDDVARAIVFCLETPALAGPVNVVAPAPVTNAEFTKTLGRVLSRPTLFPLPAFAAKVGLGEMGEALLLSSARVEPARLLGAGFRFHHTALEETLRAIFNS